ncbi:unnamed protein product, partial [Phaeothamnion confervicola]
MQALVKTTYNGDMRLFELETHSITALRTAVQKLYGLNDPVFFTYTDSDGDAVVFDRDDEFSLALRTQRVPLKVQV